MLTNIRQTCLQFPEIALHTREAHYLRGYFGNLFKEYSPLLHNHFDDGTLIYRYPLVQYKVLNEIPTLIGLGEGATLLLELFTKIKELVIGNQTYPVNEKHLSISTPEIGLDHSNLYDYHFETLWMALNQNNYNTYIKTPDQKTKNDMLQKILIGNILSFYKSTGYHVPSTILVRLKVRENFTRFKDQSMLGFSGSFVSNALLPDRIGLGKSVSRGFGTLKLQT